MNLKRFTYIIYLFKANKKKSVIFNLLQQLQIL